MSDAGVDHSPVAGVPQATYRLQLGAELRFADAADLVDLLSDLGVSHIYLSPVFKAAPGSTHGYDVADPTRVADILGGEEGLRDLSRRAAERGMGLVVDIVPNHMAAHPANPHWAELLRTGRSGGCGDVFDVDWRGPVPELAERVLLPVLGDRYGAVLENGEFAVVEDGDGFAVAYYDHRFPLKPDTVEAVRRIGTPEAFDGTPGDEQSFDRLHALLEAQHYRLVHWRVGDRLVNYRRFFTITDLAAVRVEDDDVFELVHGTLLRLVDEGVVGGLRVDHPDGLRDPGRYFERLAERSSGAWTVAEKITHPGERLPDWPVAGTTGYDFCNDVMGVLAVDATAEAAMTALDADLGGGGTYADAAAAGKCEILMTGLASDTDRVARLLWTVTQRHRRARDVDLRSCHDAIVGLVAGIGVYRPYVDPRTATADDHDRDIIRAAVDHAIAADAAPRWLLEFAETALLGEVGDSPEHLDLIARFPQLSSAAVAKGTEDTAFYRYRRLLALNEVGGDPGRFGMDVDDFHRGNAERQRLHPHAMLTTATHDTKRGEDTRLRMAALSEIPDLWASAARTWTSRLRPPLDGQVGTLAWQTMVGVWPLASTRPGTAWRDRVVAYLVKAEREASQRTTWTEPDASFEAALVDFVDALLDDDDFISVFADLADLTAQLAMVTGLSQVLLRCTAPGVPDTYQGMELWDDNLVDPDNRRPVDWEHRRSVLAGVADASPRELWDSRRDGRVKAHVLQRALHLRAQRPSLFGAEGRYEPLQASGAKAQHVVAFARMSPRDAAVVVATRLPGGLGGDAGGSTSEITATGDVWDDTVLDLPEAGWRDVLTDAAVAGDGPVAVREVLGTLPVALLVRD